MNQRARSSSGRTGRGTTCWFGDGVEPLIAAGLFRHPLGALSGAIRLGSRVTFTLPVPRGSHRPALAPWPWKRYSSRSSP